MAGYYDYVLGAIPAVMLIPTLSATLLGLPVSLAVILGGAGAVPLIGHAMFVRGPSGENGADGATTERASGSASDGHVPAGD